MIAMINEEKFSTPAIPVGGTYTHGRHKLASVNQLTKQYQSTTTWTD